MGHWASKMGYALRRKEEKREVGQNQGTWVALRRKEHNLHPPRVESSRAREKNGIGCLGFGTIKLSFENTFSYYEI
jgi:hypothetical protein